MAVGLCEDVEYNFIGLSDRHLGMRLDGVNRSARQCHQPSHESVDKDILSSNVMFATANRKSAAPSTQY